MKKRTPAKKKSGGKAAAKTARLSAAGLAAASAAIRDASQDLGELRLADGVLSPAVSSPARGETARFSRAALDAAGSALGISSPGRERSDESRPQPNRVGPRSDGGVIAGLEALGLGDRAREAVGLERMARHAAALALGGAWGVRTGKGSLTVLRLSNRVRRAWAQMDDAGRQVRAQLEGDGAEARNCGELLERWRAAGAALLAGSRELRTRCEKGQAGGAGAETKTPPERSGGGEGSR